MNDSKDSSSHTIQARTAFFLTLLYLAMVFIRPQEFVSTLQGIPLLPALLAVTLFAWLLSAPKTIDLQQLSALTLLFGFAILSVPLSGWMGGVVPAAVKLVPIYVLFMLIAGTAVTPGRQRLVMWVFVGGAAMMAAHGIQQKLTGVGWTGEVPVAGRIRYIGIFNDPNDVGLVLVCSLPMAFYLLYFYRALVPRLLVAITIGVILYGVILTNSRGTTLATAVVAGLYLWRSHGLLRTVLFGIFVIPVILMMSTRIETISASEESAHGRIEAWYEGFQMLKSSPLFGVGFDRFTEHNPSSITAHNSYVLALAELGIFGYTLWFSFLLSCVAMMLYLHPPPPRPPRDWEILVEQYSGKPAKGTLQAWEAEQGIDLDGSATPVRKISREDTAIADVILFSFVGYATAAFFLSRTYEVVLFVLCAMAAGHYLGVRRRTAELPPLGFFNRLGWWVPLSMASIAALYLTMKVLLALS